MFGGTVIGIFLLVIAIEGVRRAGREYDRHLVRQAIAKKTTNNNGTSTPGTMGSEPDGTDGKGLLPDIELASRQYKTVP